MERKIRKLRLGALALTFFVAASCSCGRGGTTAQVSIFQPRLEKDGSGAADYLLDFGTIAVGDRKVESIEVGNGGSTALVVAGGKVGKPFSHDIPADSLAIPVGASGHVASIFAPEEETDAPVEAIVELFTNEGDGKRHTVRLRGQGREPSLRCEPLTLDFGTLPKGASKTLTASCMNPLPIPIEVRAERFRGSNAESFSATLAGGDQVIAPAQGAIEVEVTFSARSLGANDAALVLYDAFQQPLASLRGIARVVLGSLELEPGACLDFSYVKVGERRSRSFSLRAIGGEPLRITGISLPQHGQSEFSIVSAPPISLPADGAPRELEVEFHPSSAGPKRVEIELTTDDPVVEARRVIACAMGFGGGPSLSCTPDSLDFGMVAVGMPARRSFSCLNAAEPVAGAIDSLAIDGVHSTSGIFSARILHDDGSEGPKRGGYASGETFTVEVEYAPTEERFDAASIVVETHGDPAGVHELPVAGQGRVLPPCDFTIEPPVLRFGTVERGDSLTLPFRIRNHLDTSCLIYDLRLAAGSDPSFSVAPMESVELLGNQVLELEVTFAPKVTAPRVEGAVEFRISNPSRPEQRVELSGNPQKPCLLVEPQEIDFGKVAPGCESRERKISVRNICTAPLDVSAINVDGEDPAAFQIRSRPLLPRPLQVNEKFDFTMSFLPGAEGTFRGSIEIDAGILQVARLVGQAARNPIQTDRFDQKGATKVDILWVIDNSGSFDPYQERLAENLPAFLTTADAQNIDYHIAVTTSGLIPLWDCGVANTIGGAWAGENGRFFPVDGSHPRILTRDTPDLAIHWAHNVRVGTCHYQEEYIEAAYRALSEPLINEVKDSRNLGPPGTSYNDGNAGFLRRDAFLSIIFVADEPDQSIGYGRSLDDYLLFFSRLKGSSSYFRAHGIVGGKEGGPETCLNNADRIQYLIESTEGSWLNICTPTSDAQAWTEGLKKMSAGAFGMVNRFVLRGIPGDSTGDQRVDEGDIQLDIDGFAQTSISSTGQRRWIYDPVNNSIEFAPLFVPKPGAQVSVTYLVGCGSP